MRVSVLYDCSGLVMHEIEQFMEQMSLRHLIDSLLQFAHNFFLLTICSYNMLAPVMKSHGQLPSMPTPKSGPESDSFHQFCSKRWWLDVFVYSWKYGIKFDRLIRFYMIVITPV